MRNFFMLIQVATNNESDDQNPIDNEHVHDAVCKYLLEHDHTKFDMLGLDWVDMGLPIEAN